jgi:hypothetical protein
MKKIAVCPSCGAPVVFKIENSLVVVCEFCHSVVARTDQKIEDLGKVAELAESDSPLSVGLRGKFNGKSFELTGRAQIKHQLGGVWDEWYAVFSNGKWGWLAEAQGRFFMTFERALPKEPPPHNTLVPGQEIFRIRSAAAAPGKVEFGQEMMALAKPLTVAEVGTGEYSAAEGEIPFRLEPGKRYGYADLSGTEGEFGTLDYGQVPPRFFLGKEVTLQDLGLSDELLKKGGGKEKKVQSTALTCPHCGGSLTLHAPDKTERVICQYCNSELDANQGKLKYLRTLDAFKTPLIPLGAKAEFEGQVMTMIGYMQRSTLLEGERWYWDEYLLYHPAIGYRWLVYSDDEWSYVKSVPVGEVVASGNSATYAGRNFYCTQRSAGRVENVVGEFYWRVSAGETTDMEDFQSGSQRLSKETYSYGENAGEVTWSAGVPIANATVCKKFGLPYSQLAAGAAELPPWVVSVIAIVVICVVMWIIYEAATNANSWGGTSSSRSGGTWSSGGWSSGGHSGGFGGGK